MKEKEHAQSLSKAKLNVYECTLALHRQQSNDDRYFNYVNAQCVIILETRGIFV